MGEQEKMSPFGFPHYWGLGGVFFILRQQNPQTPRGFMDTPLDGSLPDA